MRLTRFTHACVRLEHDGRVLVIDPGVWSEPRALLVPLQASWLKTAEAIDFVTAVGPRRAFGIHDARVNARGLASVNGWLAERAGGCCHYLTPGASA